MTPQQDKVDINACQPYSSSCTLLQERSPGVSCHASCLLCIMTAALLRLNGHCLIRHAVSCAQQAAWPACVGDWTAPAGLVAPIGMHASQAAGRHGKLLLARRPHQVSFLRLQTAAVSGHGLQASLAKCLAAGADAQHRCDMCTTGVLHWAVKRGPLIAKKRRR
jgi:hypothetical protein